MRKAPRVVSICSTLTTSIEARPPPVMLKELLVSPVRPVLEAVRV